MPAASAAAFSSSPAPSWPRAWRTPCSIAPAAFHDANSARARAWPHTMIATATHDTKRGEDARARLLALSEMPDQWARALELWREAVSPHLSDAATAPDAND